MKDEAEARKFECYERQIPAGTFNASDKIKIKGGAYRWLDTKDGYFSVFDVPIMCEVAKGTKGAPADVDKKELEHYVEIAQERYNSGKFAATVFLGHNADIPISSPDFLGYVLPNRVGLHPMEGGERWTVFADLKLARAAFEKAKRGELPYHSPEVPWEKRRISGLAFLDSQPPHFEFPLFTLGDPIGEGEAAARSRFSSVTHDRGQFLQDAPVQFRSANAADPGTAVPDVLCPGCAQKQAEIDNLKKIVAKYNAEETSKMESEKKTEPSAKPNPIPLEPSKTAAMGLEAEKVIAMFAERDARIAELAERLRLRDEEDKKRKEQETQQARVAKAKQDLSGYILSPDIEQTLATFSDDEKKLSIYVDSLKKNAQRNPPSIGEWKGIGIASSDPALAKFAQQGPDVLERASKYAAQYREMKTRGWPISSTEEQYVEFNLRNPVA